MTKTRKNVVTISATSALPVLTPWPPTAGTPRLAASVTADGKIASSTSAAAAPPASWQTQ